MEINRLHIDDIPKIMGLAKITKTPNSYGLRAGLYPIIYFEQDSVQIAVEDEQDFMYIDRNDCEWVGFADDQLIGT